MNRPVRDKELWTAYKIGLGVITVLLVGLFLQKGTRISAFLLIALLGMAALGCLMINTGVIGVVTRGRQHHHRLRPLLENPRWYVSIGVLGAGLVALAIAIIDQDRIDVPAPPESQDYRDSSIALRELQHAENDASVRFLVVIVNRTQSTVLLNRAEFGVAEQIDASCADAGNVYAMSQAVSIKDGVLHDLKVEALEGPFAGREVSAEGTVTDLCRSKGMTLQFPVSISVSPAETAHLALDIPHKVNVVEKGAGSALGANPAPQLKSIPVSLDSPAAMFSARVRSSDGTWACISVRPTDSTPSGGCR
jgi:hypothetical protein